MSNIICKNNWDKSLRDLFKERKVDLKSQNYPQVATAAFVKDFYNLNFNAGAYIIKINYNTFKINKI